MKKDAIATADAPAAIGPYSQAVRSGDLLFISGQIPINPESGRVVEGGIEEAAHQVLKNLAAITKAAGADLSDIVKTTIFLTDLNDFAPVNKIYGEYFTEPYPARATVQVAALPLGVAIEIEAIARL